MARSFTLVLDASQAYDINNARLYVAVSLLLVYLVTDIIIQTHYIFLGVLYIRGEAKRKRRLQDHGSRLILFGIAALLSMNFLQYSIAFPIMSWITLAFFLVNQTFIFFPETQESRLNTSLAALYGSILLWYLLILFFYIFNLYS